MPQVHPSGPSGATAPRGGRSPVLAEREATAVSLLAQLARYPDASPAMRSLATAPYSVREGESRLCFVRDPGGYRIERIERG